MTATITTSPQRDTEGASAPPIEAPPVLAIDPSYSGFAVEAAWHEGPEGLLRIDTIERAVPAGGTSPRARVDRIERLLHKSLETLVLKRIPGAGAYDGLLLIEGYAYGRAQKAHNIGELGGLLRQWVVDHWCGAVVEVAPSLLKKFATGKGNAGKAAVASALAARYGRAFVTDNEADAYGLLRIGRCVVGAEAPQTKAQREAVEAVRADYLAELEVLR